jgi:hypothetical protein
MNAASLLRTQLARSFELIAELAEETSDGEWSSQVTAGQNPPGFTIWHCARAIDWAINCAIRGVPEVAGSASGQALLASTAWFGYDVSLETACEVAASVPRAAVVEYAGEVKKNVMPWMDALTEEELDAVPDLERNYRSNGMYLGSPRLQEWIKEDAGTPVWELLAGTCTGHVRAHFGEVKTQLQVLRSRVAT